MVSCGPDGVGTGLFGHVVLSGAEMTALTVRGGFRTPGGAVVFVGRARAAAGADGSCTVEDF